MDCVPHVTTRTTTVFLDVSGDDPKAAQSSRGCVLQQGSLEWLLLIGWGIVVEDLVRASLLYT